MYLKCVKGNIGFGGEKYSTGDVFYAEDIDTQAAIAMVDSGFAVRVEPPEPEPKPAPTDKPRRPPVPETKPEQEPKQKTKNEDKPKRGRPSTTK